MQYASSDGLQVNHYYRTLRAMVRRYIEEDDSLPELEDLLRPKLASPSKNAQPHRDQLQASTANEASLTRLSKQRAFRKEGAEQSLFRPLDASKLLETSRLQRRRTESRASPRKVKTGRTIGIFEDNNDAILLQDVKPSLATTEEPEGVDAPRIATRISTSRPRRPQVTDPSPNAVATVTGPSVESGLNDLPDPFSGPRVAPQSPIPSSSHRPSSSYSEFDHAAILHYTPPKRVSPSKRNVALRSTTPPPQLPPSPSKKLNSPTKSRFAAIPQGTIRESLDAFWSQDVVNDLNEQYSPRKMVASPRKNRYVTPTSDDENDPPSPSTSPRKARPNQKNASPVKSKELREMKKAWDARKRQLAQDFLSDLDDTIVKGELANLAASTGGVQLVWSKKLNTTAGRANWRREKVREAQSDGSSLTWYRHTASIELAEKVIDDEVKLINVVAHEFCHLCNFMINGVRDNPHGKEFKEW